MKRLAAGLAATALATGLAWAGDPPPAANDLVVIRLSAKVGDVFRFRTTEAAGSETDERVGSKETSTREYTETVKSVRTDGGLEIDVELQLVRGRRFDAGAEKWSEVDTSKPLPQGADDATTKTDAVLRAMVGHAFRVTLDNRGEPIAVGGLREAIRAGLKGSPVGKDIPVDSVIDDDACMALAAELFRPTPVGERALAAKWTERSKREIDCLRGEYQVESTLSSATADVVTVTSRFSLKPCRSASDDDAAATAGAGERTTTCSRKDGLPVMVKEHMDAKRELGDSKTTAHLDWTIERLPPAAAKPADPTNTTRIEATKTSMRAIKDAITLYYLKHNRIPQSLSELCGPKGDERWLEMEKPPKDGWGNEFVYTVKGKREFDLMSYGADGREGGEKDAKDITLANLNKSTDDDK